MGFCMALTMNSMGIPGGFRGNAGFREIWVFGVVSGNLGPQNAFAQIAAKSTEVLRRVLGRVLGKRDRLLLGVTAGSSAGKTAVFGRADKRHCTSSPPAIPFFAALFRGESRTPRPAAEPRDGPARNFQEKLHPGPKFWTLNPTKIPKKYPQKYQTCPFSVYFSRYFLGIFLGGSRISARFFSVSFVEIPGCSRSERSSVESTPAAVLGILRFLSAVEGCPGRKTRAAIPGHLQGCCLLCPSSHPKDPVILKILRSHINSLRCCGKQVRR